MSVYATGMSLVLATLLFLTRNTCPVLGDSIGNEWWENTLIYRISPIAYQDSDGDGHGDLQGIITRLDYIQNLGVETICLNSIYPTPLIDSGYDVSDYKNIHPIFGNLSDFDELLEESHERDIRVILDVVPNHSSDQHEWFNASIYKIEPYTDYYIWENGTVAENGTRIPPNNWTSAWNSEEDSAWTWNDQRDQWYYHKFHESQPDLQLSNENVRQEIMLILEFWMDRGVDGFRILGVPYFFENPDIGFEENAELLYQIRSFVDAWTKITNTTSKLLVAGSCDTDMNSLTYYGTDDVSGILPLNCRFITDINITGNTNASEIEAEIEEWLNLIPTNASTNWPLWNNDESRVTSRVGSDRLDALLMLSMLLPGQAYTYYGDEIGILDTPILSNEIVDTTHNRNEYAEITSRDPASTPMQWDDTNAGGFSTSENTYVSVNDDYLDNNVEEQMENPKSHLNVYKTLAQLRKDPVFVRGDWELESLNDDAILVLRRTLTDHPVYLVIINFQDDEQTVNVTELYPDLNDFLDVVVTSSNDYTNRSTVPRDAIDVLPFTGLVLRGRMNDDDSTESYIDIDNPIEEETINDYEETATSMNDDEENTTEEIEMTTVSIDETIVSSDVSIPETTTQVPSFTTVDPEPASPTSASSDAKCTTLQLQVIIGFAITTAVRVW